jgi:transcriptional repressor NrdR
MRCPFCNHERDRVVDSRASEDGVVIRRRRQCQNCSRRFTTYERVEHSPLRVIKKDGRREPFDRQKIRGGIERACWNLAVGPAEIESAVARVERTIYDHYEQEVNSHEIGELVMNELKNLSQVAYVRFASVYREFKEVEEFVQVLSEFLKNREAGEG